jgi:hypothetical protein
LAGRENSLCMTHSFLNGDLSSLIAVEISYNIMVTKENMLFYIGFFVPMNCFIWNLWIVHVQIIEFEIVDSRTWNIFFTKTLNMFFLKNLKHVVIKTILCFFNCLRCFRYSCLSWTHRFFHHYIIEIIHWFGNHAKLH